MNHAEVLSLADASLADGLACVLCTVVRLQGSGYGRPGARLLVNERGRRAGYVSGGCLERDLCRRAFDVTGQGAKCLAFDTRGNPLTPGAVSKLAGGCEGVVHVLCERIEDPGHPALESLRTAAAALTPTRSVVVYRDDADPSRLGDRSGRGLESFLAAGETQTVRIESHLGVTEAFIEVIPPRRRVLIFGNGHDVPPVIAAAAGLGWRLEVLGRRDVAASDLSIGEAVDAVLMTHDFETDARLLAELLDGGVRSVGILGPKRRLGRLVQRLHGRGRHLSDSEIAKIQCPVGLDIGAVTPAEIAVSIVAALLAIDRGRAGGRLHDRRGPLGDVVPHRVVRPSPVAADRQAAESSPTKALAASATGG